MALFNDWKFKQFDVNDGFFNVELEEVVYKTIYNFKIQSNLLMVWNLNKALYGFRQALVIC